MFTLVQIKDRMNLMPKYLKDARVYLRFEGLVYDFAHELLGDQYSGGYWEFYETGHTFFFAPGQDGEEHDYAVYSPNGSEGQLSRIETGMVITSFALSHVSFYAYERGLGPAMVGNVYRALLDLFEGCEHIETMFALID